MRAGDGEHHVGAIAGGDHRRALAQPLQDVFGGHAGDHHVHHLAAQQRVVAVHQHPSTAVSSSPTVGATSSGSSGST